jgi:hypothetical protein
LAQTGGIFDDISFIQKQLQVTLAALGMRKFGDILSGALAKLTVSSC